MYGKGRLKEGDDSLARLTGLDPSDVEFKNRQDEILASIALEEGQSKSLTFGLLFHDKSETQVGKRIWLSWDIAFGAPPYGGTLIVFYCASLSTFSALLPSRELPR